MKDLRVAKRYAAALFGIAARDGILDAVSQDLTLIERFLADVPYLRAVLFQPQVPEARKVALANEAFGDRITATSLNFLRLLVHKRREDMIGACIADFRALYDAHLNRVEATATTAVPLTPEQAERLTASLRQLTGKTVHLALQIDPAILGGTVVRLGDTVIDGSIRGRLARLEQQLLGGI